MVSSGIGQFIRKRKSARGTTQEESATDGSEVSYSGSSDLFLPCFLMKIVRVIREAADWSSHVKKLGSRFAHLGSTEWHLVKRKSLG
jgi:hypothetical protein